MTDRTDNTGDQAERVAVMTRLPAPLAQRLRAMAADEHRSQSRMIEVLLHDALTEREQRPADTPAA